MKYFIMVISCVFCIVSCDNDYNIIRIPDSDNYRYSIGKSEGAILQKKEWRKPGGRQNGKFIFTENNLEILLKYLYECNKLIDSWFREDKSNIHINKWFAEGNDHVSTKYNRDNYLSWLGSINTDNKIPDNLSEVEIEKAGIRAIEFGRNYLFKLKHIFVFELSDPLNGGIECSVFYSENDPLWINIYPPTIKLVHSTSFTFYLTISNGIITIDNISENTF